MNDSSAIRQFKITGLKDIKLSELEVVNSDYEIEKIYEVSQEGQSLGLFYGQDLKQYLQENEEVELTPESLVRKYNEDEWQNLFDHPYFQRRKPQIVEEEPEALEGDEEFYLLDEGQKTGPYEKGQILTMLMRKEVLFTDMISMDKGYTWNKIFQIENFDRRFMGEEEHLPEIPTNKVFSFSTEEVYKNLQERKNIETETDAIAGFAYFGQVQNGNVSENEDTDVKNLKVQLKAIMMKRSYQKTEVVPN